MIITINNKAFNYLNALETEEYFNGSSRRTLTIECDKNAISIDELNALLSNEDNLKDVVLTNEELSTSNIYSGYMLKLKCGIESTLIESETLEAPATYEDRLIFKLGKRTYIEEQLKKLGL